MASRTSNAFLVFAGSVIALVAVALILTWQIATGSKPGDLDARRGMARTDAREKLELEYQAMLTTEGWVDKAKGIVRVPVASVFSATAADLRSKKPAASQVKLVPPLPMSVLDPNAVEPPPPALPSAPQGADTIRFDPPEEGSPSLNPPAATAPAVPADPVAPSGKPPETSPLTK